MADETIAQALRGATAKLAETSDTARLDAELLMAHALGVSRSDLLMRHMGDPVPAGFAALLARRAEQEPVAHIVGWQEFYGLDFEVSGEVLIPRGDSECLIEAARARFADAGPERILDLGTGSGALLIAALAVFSQAQGVGIERSASALDIARRNALRLVAPVGRCAMKSGDWTQTGWAAELGQFDLILCNPPYVESDAQLARSVHAFEPAEALFAGEDGLDDYKVLIPQLKQLLRSGGCAILEIGYRQAEPVAQLAVDHGFSTQLQRDLAGRARALLLDLAQDGENP